MISVVDFHSHILPGIDDGSDSVEQSVAMLRMEAEQGIRTVVATPHFYARRDNLQSFLERRAQAEQLLKSEMRSHSGLPEVLIGAEVRYYSGISNSDAISNLVIGDTKYILIEMPHTAWTEEMYQELENIHAKQGLTPIVAHIDRYISPWRSHGIPKRLAQLPVLVQANGEFFQNRHTASLAIRMLRDGKIHLLGSDCHGTSSRKPNLADALAVICKRLGPETVAAINRREQRVLTGK